MNSFTLALLLLCAPSLPNPLRLLVLDDPLQNMDEMTVSSLARGIGRLVRIYPAGWRIVALFHAEEDLPSRARGGAVCRLSLAVGQPDGRRRASDRRRFRREHLASQAANALDLHRAAAKH